MWARDHACIVHGRRGGKWKHIRAEYWKELCCEGEVRKEGGGEGGIVERIYGGNDTCAIGEDEVGWIDG